MKKPKIELASTREVLKDLNLKRIPRKMKKHCKKQAIKFCNLFLT